MNNPQRGEVWLTDMGNAGKIRPALVLSIPALDQDRALVTVVGYTTTVRGTRFEVVINVKF
jgi:mRNA interferase MazF